MLIEKGIPVPAKCAARIKYPLDQMQPGDSFSVPVVKSEATKLRNSLNSAIKYRHGNGWKFLIRSVDSGLRVWRES